MGAIAQGLTLAVPQSLQRRVRSLHKATDKKNYEPDRDDYSAVALLEFCLFGYCVGLFLFEVLNYFLLWKNVYFNKRELKVLPAARDYENLAF
jgi:hypothetical protein